MAAQSIDISHLLRPVSVETFFSDYHDQKPLYVPADRADKFAGIMTWQILNDCLNMTAIWSDVSLEMVLDTAPVPPQQYCRQAIDRNDQRRWQPDATKVVRLLRRGASLVANDIDTLHPGLVATADALEAALGGKTQCNLYCSWAQHQAFDVHYDTHEVFVLHAEGEKRWRIYENRVDRPIAHPTFKTVPQSVHDKRKGALLFDIELRPGDLLYIPRGFYHEALAASAGTVHVSCGVTHVIGLDLVNLLLDHAVADPLFRANFPLPKAGEAASRTHIEALAARLGELAAADQVAADMAQFRSQFRNTRAGYALPDDALESPDGATAPDYAVTATDLEIVDHGAQPILRSSKGAVPIPTGQEALVAWILEQGAFSRSAFDAAFAHVTADTRESTLQALDAMKVLRAVPTRLSSAPVFASPPPITRAPKA